MRGVQVNLGAQCHHVPAHLFADLHRGHRQVGKDKTVDRVHQVGFAELVFGWPFALFITVTAVGRNMGFLHHLFQKQALVFIHHREQAEKLAVNPQRAAVRLGLPLCGHHNGTDQPGIGVAHFIDVAVVQPDQRTGVVRPRSGTFRHRPVVGMGTPRRHMVICHLFHAGAVKGHRTFGRLVIEYAMRMHRCRHRRMVLEHHVDGVAHFGMDDRPQNAARGIFDRHRCGKSIVGVPDKADLVVNMADPPWPFAHKHQIVFAEFFSHHQVAAFGGIVPLHLFGGDVIGAQLPVLRKTGGRPQKGGDKTGQECGRFQKHVRIPMLMTDDDPNDFQTIVRSFIRPSSENQAVCSRFRVFSLPIPASARRNHRNSALRVPLHRSGRIHRFRPAFREPCR